MARVLRRRTGAGRSITIGPIMVGLIIVGLVVFSVDIRPAAACICAPGTVEELKARTDVGFIGTLFEKGERGSVVSEEYPSWDTPYHFTVERWLHGSDDAGPAADETLMISAPDGGGACGFEVRVGERAAVFATEAGDRLIGGLCSTLPAGVALAQIDPPRPADGEAVLAVLAGLDDELVAYFDRDGVYLGSDGERPDDEPQAEWWPQRVWPCADGEHLLATGSGTTRLISAVTASEVATIVAEDHGGYAAGARCEGPAWARSLWETSDSALRLDDLATGIGSEPTGLSTPGGAWTLASDGTFYRIEYGSLGERLLATGPDGATTELTRHEWGTSRRHVGIAQLAMSPDGERLAVIEVDHGDPAESATAVRIVSAGSPADPGLKPLAAREYDGEEAWEANWVDDRHLALRFGTDEFDRVEIVDASTLTTVGESRGWPGGWVPQDLVLVDGNLWGIQKGTLFRAPLGGVPEAVFHFPTVRWSPLLVLAEPLWRGDEAPATAAQTGGRDSANTSSATADATSAAANNTTADTNTAETHTAGSSITGESSPGGSDGPWRSMWPVALALAVVTCLGMSLFVARHRQTD